MTEYKLSITYELVTPLFMGGANQHDPPEVRPSAIRAALRFWWRALWAGTHGDDLSPTALEAAEAKLFGSTETGSPIVVRVTQQPDRYGAHQFRKYVGLDYLFFAFRGTRQNSAREGFTSGQQFRLKISVRPGAKFSNEEWNQLCAAVWLFTRFGSLGSRSRRGAGSVTVLKSPQGDWPEGFPSLAITGQSAGEFLTNSREGIHTILTQHLQWGYHAPPDLLPKMSLFHPNFCGIYLIGKAYSNWQSALDEIGGRFQSFRQKHAVEGHDRDVKQVVLGRGQHVDSVDRAAFGLPIVFFYKDERASGMLQGDKGYDRRGSPLYIRPVQLANGQIINMLIHFQAQFLPKDIQMKLKGRGTALIDQPNPNLIFDFINSISNPQFDPDLFISKRGKIKLDWAPKEVSNG